MRHAVFCLFWSQSRRSVSEIAEQVGTSDPVLASCFVFMVISFAPGRMVHSGSRRVRCSVLGTNPGHVVEGFDSGINGDLLVRPEH
jgi:hypothetical protein